MIAAQDDDAVKYLANLIKVENMPNRDAAFKLLTKQIKSKKDLNKVDD